MANESAKILHLDCSQERGPDYSLPFKLILRKWKRVTIELNAAFEKEEMNENGQQSQIDIEETFERAGRDQRDVFESIAKLDATKIEDVLAKLELWKVTACPTLEAEQHLSLAEKVLLSAHDDLQRLLVLKAS